MLLDAVWYIQIDDEQPLYSTSSEVTELTMQ